MTKFVTFLVWVILLAITFALWGLTGPIVLIGLYALVAAGLYVFICTVR